MNRRRLLLRALLLVAAVPAAAVLWHTPLSTGHRRLEDAALEPYVAALRAHGRPPVEYVLGQLARRDVVILGEAHRVRQDAGFVRDLIPIVYERAGVRTLLIEFGSTASQPDADRLLRAPTYDRRLAKRLLDDFGYLWLYEEYLELYRAAWELNARLPPGAEPFRILLGSPPDEEASNKDAVMADLVLREVEAGRKVLVYCGRHHGFTGYRQPIPFERIVRAGGGPGRMGNRLHDALGERVAFVMLHAPSAKRWAFFAWPLHRKPLLLLFGGVIDQAHAAYGAPVGFDTSLEPFASLEDVSSYYSLHRGRLRLSDFAEGYVILAPLAERRAVRPFDDLGEDGEIEHLRRRYRGSPYGGALEDVDTLRDRVRTDGLMPERAYELIDRSGVDGPAWLPATRAFWPALALAVAAWATARAVRRRRTARRAERAR